MEVLLKFLLVFACNGSSMQTARGDRCALVTEKYAPTSVTTRLGDGTVEEHIKKCRFGGILVNDECVVTRIVIQK